MITPNKFTTFEESAISKLPILLAYINQQVDLGELYKATSNHFSGIDQFMYAVDVLYVLKRLDLDNLTDAVTIC